MHSGARYPLMERTAVMTTWGTSGIRELSACLVGKIYNNFQGQKYLKELENILSQQKNFKTTA